MATETPDTPDPDREPPLDEAFVEEEEEAAASEAGAVGGRRAEGDDASEAERPVEEAGGGVAEGFEDTEEELIEHASHGDPAPDPTANAGATEAERSDAEYGEADHEESSEQPDADR
jgi:hypothetical protein